MKAYLNLNLEFIRYNIPSKHTRAETNKYGEYIILVGRARVGLAMLYYSELKIIGSNLWLDDNTP